MNKFSFKKILVILLVLNFDTTAEFFKRVRLTIDEILLINDYFENLPAFNPCVFNLNNETINLYASEIVEKFPEYFKNRFSKVADFISQEPTVENIIMFAPINEGMWAQYIHPDTCNFTNTSLEPSYIKRDIFDYVLFQYPILVQLTLFSIKCQINQLFYETKDENCLLAEPSMDILFKINNAISVQPDICTRQAVADKIMAVHLIDIIHSNLLENRMVLDFYSNDKSKYVLKCFIKKSIIQKCTTPIVFNLKTKIFVVVWVLLAMATIIWVFAFFGTKKIREKAKTHSTQRNDILIPALLKRVKK